MQNPPPRLTEKGAAEQLARRAREAAALRDNLRRRKEQSRLRDQASPAAEKGPPPCR